MKFFIYNPGPLESRSNPICNKFHFTTTNPLHCFDCYKERQRLPLSFQCSDRVLELSEPHPRYRTKKYEKELWPYKRTRVVRETKISSRLEHLAAPIFRRVFTTKQILDHHPNVKDHVKTNVNLNVQKKFPKIPDSKRKLASLSGEEFDRRMKSIERLSRPRKQLNPEIEITDMVQTKKRPVNMDAIKRLSTPRKIKSPDLTFSFSLPSRPLKSIEYYEKLSQPRKVFEDNKEPEPTLNSMKRTLELSVQLSRLQRRKFMKGDNDKFRFPVSRAALQYQPSAKINKLAIPKKVAMESNEAVVKRKKKK